ncbi:hypothetical protein DFH07DRAFT_322906 [Mycena maculata]|uniref:Uncharacterized protein n=1 Tax=Mycena maculata TaxID=230809 RepID=A0AAD7NZQ7_9AGAR|nr:hypothetical protein DFH07DRAFT_322906 [Mycena maculata]
MLLRRHHCEIRVMGRGELARPGSARCVQKTCSFSATGTRRVSRCTQMRRRGAGSRRACPRVRRRRAGSRARACRWGTFSATRLLADIVHSIISMRSRLLVTPCRSLQRFQDWSTVEGCASSSIPTPQIPFAQLGSHRPKDQRMDSTSASTPSDPSFVADVSVNFQIVIPGTITILVSPIVLLEDI